MDEVQKVADYELGSIFDATKTPQGYWMSDNYKHFILINNDCDAGKKHNDRTINLMHTMIDGSCAVLVDNVLERIVTQIQQLLQMYLEEKPMEDKNVKSKQQSCNTVQKTTVSKISDTQHGLEVSRKCTVEVKLEIKQQPSSEQGVEILWSICLKNALPDNIILSRNVKFNEDGSVYIDYGSQLIPDVHIGQLNEQGDMQVLVDCPACSAASIVVHIRGTTLVIHGEKQHNIFLKDYLNTRHVGKFEIEVPVAKLDENKTFDFSKVKKKYENGVIAIIIPVVKGKITSSFR
jgi:HSP20 family molecular chaperone IbpA